MSVVGEKLIAARTNYEMRSFKTTLRSTDAKVNHPLLKTGESPFNRVTEEVPPVEKSQADPEDFMEKELKEAVPKTEEGIWEEKRNKIMRDFEREFGDMEVFLNEGGDRDIDRPIRMQG